MIAFFNALFSFAGTVLYAIFVKFFGDVVADKIADVVVGQILRRHRKAKGAKTFLFDNTCGNDRIDLGNQRLMVSSSFVSYFTTLLEREHNFVYVPNQIDAPQIEGTTGFDPLQRIFYNLLLASGKRIVVIAAGGGMGKTTLAAKVIRCLWSRQEIRRVLGDSAKEQVVKIKDAEVINTSPGFYDIKSFFRKVLREQLREDYDARMSNHAAIQRILNAVADRKVVFVVDNLETVDARKVNEFVKEIRPLATINSKILITTRTIAPIENLDDVYIVRLHPLQEIEAGQEFIRWHIETYAPIIDQLKKLDGDVSDRKKVKKLLKKTGGIPLIMQLVLSGVALSDWEYVDNIPENLYSDSLLDYLYLQSWNDLVDKGDQGRNALELLQYIDAELHKGHKINSKRLSDWIQGAAIHTPLATCITMLTDRFLLLNNGNSKEANFSIVPSLSIFLKKKTLSN